MRNDQIFTPDYIVTKILDMIEYTGENIREKTILEPSFGKGAFLIQIVERILKHAKASGLSVEETTEILNNVYGVEIDEKLYKETKERLMEICAYNGIDYDFPNLINGDATKTLWFNEFDYVIGNPPYIRMHDVEKKERKYIEENFVFSSGNTDLYVVFFELGLNALKEGGILSYIAPNTYMKNTSQKSFRKYLSENSLVQSIVDYGTVSVFDDIATYTAITTLHKKENQKTKYVKMKDIKTAEYETTVDLKTLGSDIWTIASPDDEKFLKKIRNKKIKIGDLCEVQFGLATNADKVYLVDPEDVDNFEKELLRPVVKASKQDNSKYMIFSYQFNESTNRFEVIDEDVMRTKYPKTHAHLLSNKEKLENRDMDKNSIWYQYARSQGIQNSNRKKFVISRFVDGNAKTCDVVEYDENTLVYSGIYIVLKDEKDRDEIKRVLNSEDFCKYLQLVGRNLSGGFKQFTAKMIKDYGIRNKFKQ